jgi:murein DD-endopeptidase MepM/ murein hydrolase activator NlpD
MPARAFAALGVVCILLMPVTTSAVRASVDPKPSVVAPIVELPVIGAPGQASSGFHLVATTEESTGTPLDRVARKAIRPLSGSIDVAAGHLREHFMWPVTGAINTSFGGGHDGIDIEGETGDKIRAARSGRITFAGDDGDGYGIKVLINHGRGISSLYSHLSTIAVRHGWAEQGSVIGRVGCTGSCTGDHLHFEIRRRGRATDPIPWLPRPKG